MNVKEGSGEGEVLPMIGSSFRFSLRTRPELPIEMSDEGSGPGEGNPFDRGCNLMAQRWDCHGRFFFSPSRVDR